MMALLQWIVHRLQDLLVVLGLRLLHFGGSIDIILQIRTHMFQCAETFDEDIRRLPYQLPNPTSRQIKHTSLLSESGIASSSLIDVRRVALVMELQTVDERCGRPVVAGLVGVDMVAETERFCSGTRDNWLFAVRIMVETDGIRIGMKSRHLLTSVGIYLLSLVGFTSLN